MARIWGIIEAGATEAGREIERQLLHGGAHHHGRPGSREAVDSPRVKAECGAMAMAAVHFSYDQFRNFGRRPPGFMAAIWDDYRQLIESFPVDRRHQRIHGGHNCWVLPEEERFLTPDILQASAMIGTRDDLIERLSVLAAAPRPGDDPAQLRHPFRCARTRRSRHHPQRLRVDSGDTSC